MSAAQQQGLRPILPHLLDPKVSAETPLNRIRPDAAGQEREAKVAEWTSREIVTDIHATAVNSCEKPCALTASLMHTDACDTAAVGAT